MRGNMTEQRNVKFTELVARRLVSEGEEVRSLWTPIAQEFDRVGGGPDAAKRYLDAQQQSLKERIESLLNLVD